MKSIIFLCLLVAVSAITLDPAYRKGGKTLGKGESCTDCPRCCSKGLSCLGNPTNKRCFALREGGEKCGKDPFWECIPSLECRNEMCIDPTGVKQSCNEPGDVCKAGLVCVGNLGNKRCFPPRLIGDKCGKDPFWECFGNLVCNDMGMCAKPIKQKGSCNAPGDACAEGLVCVGNVGNKRCFPPRRLGDKCGKDPFWVCVPGLTCDLKQKMCVKAGTKGTSCNPPNGKCEAGLVCVGNKGNKRCFPPRLLGDKCGKDPFWVCAEGICDGKKGMCVEEGTKGTSCNLPSDKCVDGLVCVGNKGNKRCFPPRLIGDKCGKDPFWECSEGKCVRGKCQ